MGLIPASSDLDEYLIDSLKAQGAKINSWGVGTNLINSKDAPAFGGVYKLAAVKSREERFASTREGIFLEKHAPFYGFILRYPKDKVSITKVAYEPWHWRYVGVEDAKKMKASGKCLEEYLGIYNS